MSDQHKAFGMKYPNRNQLPSMFQILSWNVQDQPIRSVSPNNPNYQTLYVQEYPEANVKGDQKKVVETVIQNKKNRTKTLPHQIQDHLYIEEPPIQHERKSPEDKLNKNKKNKKKRQPLNKQKVKTQKKQKRRLDPVKDKDIIKRRQQRIKEFDRQSRILPNSAFTTYYGKPAFQAYGRNNTKCNSGLFTGNYLHSHSIMPHRGENHPQNMETYKNALITAGRYVKDQPQLPRKRDENYVKTSIDTISKGSITPDKNNYNITIPKPDLINEDRFASKSPTPEKEKKIPDIRPKSITSKPLKQNINPIGKKITNNTKILKNDKNLPLESKEQKKPKAQIEQQLKFMNIRQNFMDDLQKSKLRNNRLAYKVTQCYPVVPQNPAQSMIMIKKIEDNQTKSIKDPQDYRNIDSRWTGIIPAAGKISAPHVDIRQLFVSPSK